MKCIYAFKISHITQSSIDIHNAMFHSNQNNISLNQIITIFIETSTTLHTTKSLQLSPNQYTKYHVASNIVCNTITQKFLYLIYCTMDIENISIRDVVKSVLTYLQYSK